MAYDSQPAKPERDVVAERMAEMYRRSREPAQAIPAHLKGTLFSQRDLLEPAFAAIDAEVKAFEASRARLSPREDARSHTSTTSGKG